MQEEYVSLMHGNARLANAGSETRSPQVIRSNETRPVSLASSRLLRC